MVALVPSFLETFFENNLCKKDFGKMQNSVVKSFAIIATHILLTSAADNCNEDAPTARTKFGEVRGTVLKSREGRLFAAFRGIPYAQPPVGNLRFQPPKEVDKWKGIRNATEEAPICIQQDFLFNHDPQIEGSEDCLYLNIYTSKDLCQNKRNGKLFPVMIFLHYGAFLSGSSRSDIIGPELLLDSDIVLVTFNYRLGVMGFFTTYDDEAPGNWAFKDQLAALRWVQNNIHYFGGSNKKITIAGQSAGAGSVHHLLLSPTAKGLFQGAITMSGSALALWAKPITKQFFAITNITAMAVRCSLPDTKSMVECLRNVSAHDLVNAANIFRQFIKSEPLTPYFAAVEQKTERNPEPFITEDPSDIIRKGNFHNVPWMIGVTSGEGILRAAPFVRQEDVRQKLNNNFDKITDMLAIELSVEKNSIDSLWSEVKRFYFNAVENLDSANSITGLINVYTDRAFIYPAYQSMLVHKQMGHEHIFVYNFDYRGKYTYGDLFATTKDNKLKYKWGVSHCDDLLYILNSPGRIPNYELSGTDLEVSKVMLHIFINFIKYGDPTPEHLWHPRQRWEELPNSNSLLNEEQLHFLDISGSFEEEHYYLNMTNNFYSSRMRFWSTLTKDDVTPQFSPTEMVWIKILLLASLLMDIRVSSKTSDKQLPLAITKYGTVMGTLMISRNGRFFSAFRGMPYAKPPIGELRFKAPQEPEPWSDLLDATRDSNICIQQNFLFSKEPEVEGSEDCLYINVYSPISTNSDETTNNLLPVMVAFPYGAFIAGSSSSDLLGPEYLLDRNVVLVTFNYRLGIFGFFSTYDDAAPGNWAFKDQLAALKWVQNNIAAFGGNPECVTIFGASAGAGSIHHHILSPQSKDLFHAAITQSGTALALWAQPQREMSLVVAKTQAEIVGCNSTVSTGEIVDCLRGIPAEDLVNSMNYFRFMKSEPLTVYLPAIEFETENNPEPFITEDPKEIIEKGEFSNVPWIIGVTSNEGILRAAPFVRQTDLLKTLNAHFAEYFPEMLALQFSVTEEDMFSTWVKIKEFYFQNKDIIDITVPESIQGLINVYSDRAFLYPAYQTSLLHMHKGHENVWFYYFDYKGNRTYGDVFAATENQIDFQWGVSHCDDLLYLFKSPQLFPNAYLNSSDLAMSDLMISLFTNFATYFDPTPQIFFDDEHRWKPLLSTTHKEVMQNSDLRYLKITGYYNVSNIDSIKLSMANTFHPDRMRFWTDLPLKENIQNLS
ncbi:hypothetical protein Trydic_g8268 [Trypoxylus dichotomus]